MAIVANCSMRLAIDCLDKQRLVIGPADVKKGCNIRKDKGSHVIWDVQLVLGLADCCLAFQVAVIGASDDALHHSVDAHDSRTVQSVMTQDECRVA